MNFPDMVPLAIPFFLGALAVEIMLWRALKRGDYETRDTAASLTMGLGNAIIGGATVAAVYGTFSAANSIALFDMGYQWWVFVLCFFAEDLCYYVYHRISHERRWFWASHVVHHSSQHYNLSTALRQTWTHFMSMGFLFWLPLILIGFPPDMVLFFHGVSLVYQFWPHTELIDRIGPLEWVFNSPSHHRVHHATNPKYLDSNYAGVLIIWDRLFGTFVEEDPEDPPRYGILGNLNSFNPLRIAFAEWGTIIQDVRGAKSGREIFMFLMGPPGWSPDGSRQTTASVKEAWAKSITEPALAEEELAPVAMQAAE
jgi:sterol desaturase/sphingolipid hydroxylase (fatty acid hydroxylase superfamily)